MVIMGHWDERSTKGGRDGASDGKFQTKCDKYISGRKKKLNWEWVWYKENVVGNMMGGVEI